MIRWLAPSCCFPPHPVTHPDKSYDLYLAFKTKGWDTSKPGLVGYEWGRKVQLLSGSHRWEAARKAGIKIPVRVYAYRKVALMRARGEWERLMRSGG